MAISVYDDQLLTQEQKKQLEAFTDAWNRANAAGDRAGMESAHAAAERVRAQAGYSGGADGSAYSDLGGGQTARAGGYGGYTASELPSYRAQTQAVNELYDAARDARLAQLKSAFDTNSAQLEAQREEIPRIYQAQKNSVASEAELAGRGFNEYAAASGLNSGTGGQARLAMTNELQGDLAALGAQEAAAQRELENSIAQLKVRYQNDIASALADGEYRRAEALLEEYRREQESAVSTAGAKADLDYRAWQSQLELDKYNYGKQRDALSDSRRQEELEYERARDGASDSLKEWQRQLELAELMAKYGDYSGLRALGLDVRNQSAP